MKLRKSLATLALVAAFGTLTAQAGTLAPFNVCAGSCVPGSLLVAGATSLVWNEQGSGVAIGVGPFSDSALLPVGAQFDFKYQANLVAAVGGTPTPAFAGLDATSNGIPDVGSVFEFTIVANMREVVNVSSFTSGGTSDPGATFGLVPHPANKVAIYFDTARNARTVSGTGFDDGIKVAEFTIDAGELGFAALFNFLATTGTNTGIGSLNIHGALLGALDFVDPLYLLGLPNPITVIHFQSMLFFPPGNSSTAAFHLGGDPLFPDYAVTFCAGGPPGSCDIVVKVDPENQFGFQAVPEPATLLLFGIGLLGCGVFGARGRCGGQVEGT